LGEYLGIDIVLVRIFFVLLTLAGGAGPLIYLVLWLIMPREDQVAGASLNGQEISSRAGSMRDEFVDTIRNPKQRTVQIIGISLVGAGLFYLLRVLNISWLGWFNENFVWAALLVIAGIILIKRAIKKD
jgi:hypothetical protein